MKESEKMFLWLHIILALALIILLIIDLNSKGGSTPISMVIRVIYLLMLLDGLWLLPQAWGRDPILAIIKVIGSFSVIGYLEYLMMRRAKNQLSKRNVVITFFILAALIVLGLFTAGFRPWINL